MSGILNQILGNIEKWLLFCVLFKWWDIKFLYTSVLQSLKSIAYNI